MLPRIAASRSLPLREGTTTEMPFGLRTAESDTRRFGGTTVLRAVRMTPEAFARSTLSGCRKALG